MAANRNSITPYRAQASEKESCPNSIILLCKNRNISKLMRLAPNGERKQKNTTLEKGLDLDVGGRLGENMKKSSAIENCIRYAPVPCSGPNNMIYILASNRSRRPSL